jgi:ABC-2 type transport system permease protein
MMATDVAAPERAGPPAGRGWTVVAAQELRDLWFAGRGFALLLGFSVLASVMTYLGATSEGLNLLERREAVNLTVQVAVALGALLTMLVAADAVSGERERGTLETLLVTPLSRAELVGGKLLTALSLWPAALVVAVPYVWFLGRGVGAVGDGLLSALVAGTLLAVALSALGLLVSTVARSNRISLSVSLFVLLALYAPTQLPTGAKQAWAGEMLLRLNPVTAAEHWIGKVVINGHDFTQDAAWLLSPLVAAVVLSGAALAIAPRHITLRGSARG